MCLYFFKNPEAKILDVACGTGMGGKHFLEHGFKNVDGLDGVKEMLDVAGTKGYYREHIVHMLDPSTPIPVQDNTYDGLIAAGVVTVHVTGAVLQDLIRITKPGGVIAFDAYQSEGREKVLDDFIDDLVKEGKWMEVERSAYKSWIWDDASRPSVAEYFVFRVC